MKPKPKAKGVAGVRKAIANGSFSTPQKPAKPKFPLCEKYLNLDWNQKDGWFILNPIEEVEQALSKAYEQGKKGARLEGMRIQHELEKDKRKVLEGNLEACLDINRQYEEEVKTAKQQGKLEGKKELAKDILATGFAVGDRRFIAVEVERLKSQLEVKK